MPHQFATLFSVQNCRVYSKRRGLDPESMKSARRDFFAQNGFLKLPAFHSRARLAGIKESVLKELKRSSDHAGASRSLRKLPIFQQIVRLSSLVKVRGAHEQLVTSELLEIIGEVAGQPPSSIQETQFLLSPPNQGSWTLAGMNWHVDVQAEAMDRVPGVQAFFLIDDVVPHGGATLALAGSHKLKRAGSNSLSELRDILRSHVDLENRLRCIGLTVLEMSGQAGDVYLMDMRTLHTPSINDSKSIRIMATCRCLMER
jgi:hypothetical protein